MNNFTRVCWDLQRIFFLCKLFYTYTLYVLKIFILTGHKEAVISVAFSPDGKHLASGSGDATVRLWDIYTQTPHHTCEGHRHWVLCISWSPCGSKLASACKNGSIYLWDPDTGKQIGKGLEMISC